MLSNKLLKKIVHLDNGDSISNSQIIYNTESDVIMTTIDEVYAFGELSSWNFENLKQIELTIANLAKNKNHFSNKKTYSKNESNTNMKKMVPKNNIASEFMPEHFPLDWKLRCKQIIKSCIISLGKGKMFFEKPPVQDSFFDKYQIQNKPMDIGSIREKLSRSKKKNGIFYTNPKQFHTDMILLWKNCRLTKTRSISNYQSAIEKLSFLGKKIFKREWYNCFLRDNKKFTTTKHKNIKNSKKKIKQTNLYDTNSNRLSIEKSTKDKAEVSHIPASTSSKTQQEFLEISTLVEALEFIAHETETTEFKRMFQIIKESGKLEHDENGEMVVDFGKLDTLTIRKLQNLAKEFKLLK